MEGRWGENVRTLIDPLRPPTSKMWLSPPEKSPGVIRAATQYGTASRIIDLATFDVTHNPWRCGELFDSIVTDPPCTFFKLPSLYHLFMVVLLTLLDGVRAGAKRLGRKKELPDYKKDLCLQHTLSGRPWVTRHINVTCATNSSPEMTNPTSHLQSLTNYRTWQQT